MVQTVKDLFSDIRHFQQLWQDDSPTMWVHTSGSTGTPKPICVSKEAMRGSARRTCQALGLSSGDTALLCMPVRFIAGMMMCVRAWECDLQLMAVTPSLHPLRGLTQAPTFAAMTPAQVYETLSDDEETTLLRKVRVLLIGGGAVDETLSKRLSDMPGVWSTYGMTETLSHIALRKISDEWYTPLNGVNVSKDQRGCLVVSDEVTDVHYLATNDLVSLRSDGRFRVLGRIDNVICSGGLKWAIEDLEARLVSLNIPYHISSVSDARLGEAIVLLYEGDADPHTLRLACQRLLPRHAVPRHYLQVDTLPTTPTGKPNRAALRQLSEKVLHT